jgi:serine protease AprX
MQMPFFVARSKFLEQTKLYKLSLRNPFAGNSMKYFRNFRTFLSFRSRSIVVGSLLLVMLSLFLQFRARVVSADALLTVTSVDSLFRKAPTVRPASKIAPEVLTETSDGRRASVLIFLTDQADVSAANAMKDQDARGWYVYNSLRRHAEQTQAGLKLFLATRGIEFQSFWVANMLVAEVDRATADELATRRDVAQIDSTRPARWIEDPALADFHEAPDTPLTTEWGVNNVNAPAVWAMGFTGQGMIVANQDTGMRWTHSALKPKYRGWNGTTADHNFNWHDSIHSGGGSCGPNTVEPCDDNGHGTHTTGTTIGDDGSGDQVGVAPGAKWIGCRNMDQGNGTPATYSECFQFFIAPTDLSGNNANPALRPHVMNDSWGCPASEGCTTRAELETIVNNAEAAGIFVEASAGNSGPGCSTVSDPPALYSASFSTGAIDISNTLASFSSRGPSTFYTPNLLKPNVSAPGVNVRSSTRTSDTSFGNLSGTSMAGPHVVGVVALLWSAKPQLVRDIAATKTLLQNTANASVSVSAQTCGGIPSTQIPNNTFGYGRVDVLAAVNAAGATPTATSTPTFTPTNQATSTPTATPTVSAVIDGTVTYGNDLGAPPAPRFVSNVLISGAGSPPVSATTDTLGMYSLSGFGPGAYTITPSKTGGQNGSISSFDAARISQYVVGATPFSPAQLTVADVSGAGGISSFDAALVASYAVSSPNHGMTGNWIFSPPGNTHSSVTANITEDYTALLMGEVSGNWTDSGPRPSNVSGPQRRAVIQERKIDVQDNGEMNVAISAENIADKGVISFEFDVRYDPSVLSPDVRPVDLAGTVSRGFSVVVNSHEPGLLRVAAYATRPISENGVLLKLRFRLTGTNVAGSPLKWERFVLNEDEVTVNPANSDVGVRQAAIGPTLADLLLMQ